MNEKKEFVDFVNTTGKNIGKIQSKKLADYFGVTEGGIRYMKNNDELKYDCLYLGALCKANNVTKENIIEIFKNKSDNSEVK